MNTQNTPVHIRLWHKGFWALVTANTLLYVSVTMMLPVLPQWLISTWRATPLQAGIAMLSYGAGIFLLGGFCSYLIQRYRRNRVCLMSIVAMVLSLGVLYLIENGNLSRDLRLIWLARMLTGAFYGLSQMVLSSTLIIDKTESFQRTEANHAAAWFRRFALSIGPAVAIPLYHNYGFATVTIVSAASALLGALLIRCVNFPFKSPDETVKVYSLDRFFLPQSKWLFVNVTTVTAVLGLVMSCTYGAWFYSMLMTGFFLAIISERYMLADADIKSETVIGLILICAALLLMLTRTQSVVNTIAPAFIGLGMGMIGSRFMLFFIKLSRHCQRGTSQSSFFLAWELGISLGLMAGYGCFYGNKPAMLIAAIALTAANLALYMLVTHPWYMKHKNR